MGSLGQVTPTASLEAEVAKLAALDPVTLADQEIHDGVLGLLRVLNQVAGIAAGFVGSFDARGLSEADAMRATRTWLEGFGNMSQGAATGWLKRARLLRQMPALAEASKQGTVSTEHVAKVCDLETKVGVTAIKEWDGLLADLASDGKPSEVADACARLRAYIDPDGPLPDPDAAFQRRGVSIAPCGSMYDIRGQLDPEGAAALKTALDALMKPPGPDDLRTAAQRRADALVELARLALVAGNLPTVGGVRPQLGVLVRPQTLLGTDHSNQDQPNQDQPNQDHGSHDHRSHHRRSHDHRRQEPNDENGQPATAAAHNPTPSPPPCPNDHTDDRDTDTDNRHSDDGENGENGENGDGDRAQDFRPPRHRPLDPLTQLGIPRLPEPPWMSWVGDIPPELAQRISCDCDVWRAVLDPATGLPLEVGRTHRLVPHWIRSALHARDRGCRWPGCDAPTQWTDAHHLIAWYYGGETNIGNLLLVCRYHHARVHEGHWTIHLDPTTGEVSVTRPDGRPYELGPTRPWTSPNTRGGEPPPDHTAFPAAA